MIIVMFTPVDVKARPSYRLWLRYEDGSEGEVDLSNLAGRDAFALWDDDAAFKRVSIGEDGAIRWNEEVELCPDALYLKLTGNKPKDAFPKLNPAAHA
jgi:hypothetical protein